MDTDELMRIALDLAGFEGIPEDSAVYVPGDGIRRVLFGLDVETAELLMAQQMGYDAVIAHHPVGISHRAWRVFERHVDLMVEAGVPAAAARKAIGPKLESLRVRGQAQNYEQVRMAARRLGVPLLNIHCPLDELGRRVMPGTVDELLRREPGASLAGVAGALAALPAAQRAETEVAVRLGQPAAPAGRVVVAHGAFTNGGAAVARAYYEHGVDTVIYIHISSAELQRLRASCTDSSAGQRQGQLIVTSHVVGDAFGIEPYIHALRERGLQVDVLSEVLAEPA